jgi:glycosidase
MLISRRARDRYRFDPDLLNPDGHLVLREYAAARRFAAQMSANRLQPAPASDIYAISLLDEVLRVIVRQYVLQNPGVMSGAVGALGSTLGAQFDDLLARFVDEFPPAAVYRGEISVERHLSAHPAESGQGARERTVEDLLLTGLANDNPALESYRDLFDDTPLKKTTPYLDALALLVDYFAHQPSFGPAGAGTGGSLYDLLVEPARASPYSLEGQLQFLVRKWGFLLGDAFIQKLMRGVDYIREEIIRHTGPGGFSGAAPLPDYRGQAEYERYSPDKDWMPRLVLMAKNTYVWLEQLSRKYGRWVKTLNDIPDEELALLAARGFTGLWLIGLWERSRASQRIKQRMGQADAVASAYSLHSYDIAGDLGGWEALNNLRSRAWVHGIRLSADMVPNHMGIDSAWVIEHPDWFLSLGYPPYPSYSFNSENLSDDPRVGIHLEDHYYDRTDAAVVFQRRDQHTGDARYIYHGNDGTSFPWNDTAQLDYSNPAVREAVIQTILHVARNFPVIRFDAAMTLARKHVQRLWFPEPGAGGAIPSRSEHGLSRAEFDARVPDEFWREVVDRVAAEVPDTLLLAEAFWLMEGYFVRTLGMHRVYNSAFMHMLRDEDNAKYRQLIKTTLEFDPQILKRYVNFMNNPDEKTAVEQFGNGDKYFGVAMLLATLPGLPMFGHGQVEGFHEKYGMEFRMPKLDETPDEGLVRGHEWKIFPILHRRSLFADVEQFLLYDLFRADGSVDENVFAYSNQINDDRALVIHHNKFADTRGWIKTSAAYIDKGSGDLRQKSLGEGLGLPDEGFVVFKDCVTQLEYIRPCEELWSRGLYLELGAYQHHAFMDFRFVEGDEWQAVHAALGGAGAASLEAMIGGMVEEKEEDRGKKPGKQAASKKRAAGRKAAVKKAARKTAVSKKPAAKPKAMKKSTPKKAVTKKSSVKQAPVKKSTAGKSKSAKKAVKKSKTR